LKVYEEKLSATIGELPVSKTITYRLIDRAIPKFGDDGEANSLYKSEVVYLILIIKSQRFPILLFY